MTEERKEGRGRKRKEERKDRVEENGREVTHDEYDEGKDGRTEGRM